MSKIKSNCTYEDTLSIYSKLPASDKRWFHNSFTNSPTTIFRWIEYYNGDKAGFVELDDYEKNGSLNISMAILPAYRGKGLLHKLITKAEEYVNSTKSYNRLVWCVLFGNTKSAEAAKHMGFTFFRKAAQDMVYIKDLKLDNNSIQKKIKELNDKLNKEIDYGMVVKGKVITDDDYISNNFEKYKSLSPTDFEKYKVGVCWDFCNYQSYYFDKYLPNVKYKLIYIESGINNIDNEETHTFMVYELNDKWYLFESAWRTQQGIREFSSFNKLIEYYAKVYRDYSKKHDTLSVYEYTPPNKYGQDIYEFMNHCKNGKLIKNMRKNSKNEDDVEFISNKKEKRKTCMSKIKSNCTYEDTLSIYSKLPASDKRWFHNRFVDSPRIRFRWIEYYNGDKAGFVELYDLEKNGNLNIAIAILPAYRSKGLLHKLMAKAEEYTNSTKSYNRLVWCALFGNTRSMEAAKHMGFTFFKKDTQDMIYIKDMKMNDIKKKVLSIVGNYPICVISDKLSFAIYKKSDSAIDNIVKKLKVSDISISDSLTYNDKLEKVRDSISKVKEYLISAGISSFFIISDRCSITNSKQNSVIVNKARNIQIEWEKKNGFDPDEDWSEKDTQDMITVEEESINESVLGMELYHASVESYHGKLTPIAPCFGTKLYDPHWAIYFWNDKEKVKWYATTQILRDYINKNYKSDPKLKGYASWDNLVFDYDNNRTILDENMYNYFKKKLIGKTAYIYTVKVPPHKLHNVRIGHSRHFNEYTYKEPIPIFHKEVVVMTENMFDQYHKVDSVKNIIKFNATKKFNRGIESIIFLSPVEFKVRRMKFRNLKYANKIEDGKGDLNDMIQNKNELPMIKSGKDIYCNLSKFPKENNILFVTGMSGSGKSTLTKKLAKKYNAIQISLDFLHYFPCRIIHDPNRSLEDLGKKNQYKEDRRSFEYIMKFFNSDNGKKLLNIYKKCKTNAEVSDKKVLDKLFEYLFEFIEKSNIKDPIIIEGTQLIEVPDKYLDYPFVFKSVSFGKTMYRRFKREDLDRFVAFIPQYNKWRKDQNVLRDKVISRTNDIRYSNNEEPI